MFRSVVVVVPTLTRPGKLEIMEKGLKGSLLDLVLVFMAVLQSLLFCTTRCATAPAMFIFGDSLIDCGNNNYIATIARANYYPYGIDFIGPTGRFCNGLGLPFPPPYLSVQSDAAMIMGGVNYGSAAAGILNETGKHYGSRISLNEQIELFGKTVEMQLTTLMLDPEALSDYLSSSLFIVAIGSNDYINNYLLPKFYSTSRIYSGEDFARLLVDNFLLKLLDLMLLNRVQSDESVRSPLTWKLIMIGIFQLHATTRAFLFLDLLREQSCVPGYLVTLL